MACSTLLSTTGDPFPSEIQVGCQTAAFLNDETVAEINFLYEPDVKTPGAYVQLRKKIKKNPLTLFFFLKNIKTTNLYQPPNSFERLAVICAASFPCQYRNQLSSFLITENLDKEQLSLGIEILSLLSPVEELWLSLQEILNRRQEEFLVKIIFNTPQGKKWTAAESIFLQESIIGWFLERIRPLPPFVIEKINSYLVEAVNKKQNYSFSTLEKIVHKIPFYKLNLEYFSLLLAQIADVSLYQEKIRQWFPTNYYPVAIFNTLLQDEQSLESQDFSLVLEKMLSDQSLLIAKENVALWQKVASFLNSHAQSIPSLPEFGTYSDVLLKTSTPNLSWLLVLPVEKLTSAQQQEVIKKARFLIKENSQSGNYPPAKVCWILAAAEILTLNKGNPKAAKIMVDAIIQNSAKIQGLELFLKKSTPEFKKVFQSSLEAYLGTIAAEANRFLQQKDPPGSSSFEYEKKKIFRFGNAEEVAAMYYFLYKLQPDFLSEEKHYHNFKKTLDHSGYSIDMTQNLRKISVSDLAFAQTMQDFTIRAIQDGWHQSRFFWLLKDETEILGELSPEKEEWLIKIFEQDPLPTKIFTNIPEILLTLSLGGGQKTALFFKKFIQKLSDKSGMKETLVFAYCQLQLARKYKMNSDKKVL